MTIVPESAIAVSAHRFLPDVLATLEVDVDRGLTVSEVMVRRELSGPNTIAVHQARLWPVLWHQLRSPLLLLLLVAAGVSFAVGQRSDAVIIGAIVALSVGLGFVNEFRAEKAADGLHTQIERRAVVVRDGRTVQVDVVDLVPGDVVELGLGALVPADVRLSSVTGFSCAEAVLTGESEPAVKSTSPVTGAVAVADLSCCALMGTVVSAGRARGVVVATGGATQFGAIAAGISTRAVDTGFQTGLRRFSMLLVYVAGALTTAVFAVNIVLQRPLLDALLFSLAIAVGITPQLLPAVVASSLATGAGQMRRCRVLVKRLVCIEDLGDISILFTDKTGTLTLGTVHYMRGIPVPGRTPDEVLLLAMICTEVTGDVGGNPLDHALWDTPVTAPLTAEMARWQKLATVPFDHDRQLTSVLVAGPDGAQQIICKGAPEQVLSRSAPPAPELLSALEAEFSAGNRVIAVAVRSVRDRRLLTTADESDLELIGLLVFLDAVKPAAAPALQRLSGLGIDVKIVTGDNAAVAQRVCHELGLPESIPLTGPELDELDDDALAQRLPSTTVFARVSPQQKARIVRIGREARSGVAFLGDGVNDALALHAADVGISVDSATDVAKDAADVILLEKDLDVLADGVVEGRRIFANTIKYVLMSTSSNFGNMFSAAVASLFLTFLPMLPSQILLNNLLYDVSQLAIPTDRVDEEQLHRPSHWDLGFIRRFMLVFGPLSSVFDGATFILMLAVLHAGPAEFRTGWFVESLATQTMIVFAIRTRRVPFFRSRPSLSVALAAIGVVVVGVALPATPFATGLGFVPLPIGYFAALLGMSVLYLILIEAAKYVFYRHTVTVMAPRVTGASPRQHLRRRIAHFGTAAPAGGSSRTGTNDRTVNSRAVPRATRPAEPGNR